MMKKNISLILLLAIALTGFAQQDVLLIVGNTTLTTADQAIYDRLDASYNVTVVDDAASTTGDASGKELIFISATVTSTDIGSRFTATAVPLINCEHALHDDLGMTSAPNHGAQTGVTDLLIHNSSHQMAASLTGTKTVHTSNHNFNWGTPSSAGVKVATLTTDTSKAVIFGYQNGASMVSGTAPARRVGFFYHDNSAGLWNSNSQALFDAAVAWAMGLGGSNTPPTVSITSPADSATFTAPANITITATASDSDGSIADVEFFYGSTSIGTDNSSPYSIDWEDVPAGTYSLTALATDDDGDTTRSADIIVIVNPGGSLPAGEEGNTLRHDGDEWIADSILYNDGTNIGLGTTSPRAKLDVNGIVVIGEEMYSDSVLTYGTSLMLSVDGGIVSKEVLVTETAWADYVFNENYELLSLDSVSNFIKVHNHLPGIPSAAEVEKKGLNLGEANALLLKKVEELTLYILDQQRRIDLLEKAFMEKK